MHIPIPLFQHPVPFRFFTPLGLLSAFLFWLAVLSLARLVLSWFTPSKLRTHKGTQVLVLVLTALLIEGTLFFGRAQSNQSNWLSGFVSGQLVIGGPVGTTQAAIFVSAYCGSTTTCINYADASVALNAIISNYNCTLSNAASCNIVMDMTGLQTFSQQITSTAVGNLWLFTNGASLDWRVDGTSTIVVPSAFQIHGMGTSGTDQIAQNTRWIACNPATDNCGNSGGGNANGATGFVVQNSSATTITTTVSGANPTATMQITLAAGAPFTADTTSMNSIGTVANPRVGRKACIHNSTGAAGNNGCWPLISVQVTGNGQQFTVNVDSTIAASCASNCGIVSLGTPVMALRGSSSTNATFGNRVGGFVIDGHDLPGVEGFANVAGNEGSGVDGVLQIYNAPAAGFELIEDSSYGGNCTAPCGSLGAIGVANDGPYNAISVNFNPFLVTKVGGAACSNTSVGTCNGSNLVPAGSAITIGHGTTGFGIIAAANSPVVNPNYVCVFVVGSSGNQGGGPISRLTCSNNDKTGTGANLDIFLSNGASYPAGILIIGHGNIQFLNSHIEYLPVLADVCGDHTHNVAWTETYGSIATTGVKFDTGKWDFWPASGSTGLLIGTTGGTQSLCQDIDVGALDFNPNGGTGNILTDNLLGKTIAGSATINSLNYHHGHGSAVVPWTSTDSAVGIGNMAMFPLQLTPSGSSLGITSQNAIANTETIVAKTATAMPASRLQAGTVIQAVFMGTCTSAAASAGTFAIRYGTAGTTSDGVLFSASPVASSGSGTSIGFVAILTVTIRTSGAAATSEGTLTVINTGATGITNVATQNVFGAGTAINTTTASTFLDATYISGSASITSTFQQAYITVAN